ncbi:hypothetical protein XEUV354_11350 [Xanthomonas euvesicatoria]|nr:hypothetical protein XEUV683_08675 [Xanthomonas euvesicatoria]KLA56740.1 hypothetical protein XEUV684_16065 [Xanthomonas euvesicatoria]KLA58363.1 hypothetical protein XEUV685_07070 [Xanthomonas euvesicatoria]KLA69657.1 hypothetical protein XEUV695_05125 [Xanthomonas euvesicatoria]KLA72098.1 hypothetical protein XEUV689_02875 [Xanthomonas euvesicatoria]
MQAASSALFDKEAINAVRAGVTGARSNRTAQAVHADSRHRLGLPQDCERVERRAEGNPGLQA